MQVAQHVPQQEPAESIPLLEGPLTAGIWPISLVTQIQEAFGRLLHGPRAGGNPILEFAGRLINTDVTDVRNDRT